MRALIFIDPEEKGAALLTVMRVSDDETTHQQILQPGEELAVNFGDEPVHVHLEDAPEGETNPAPEPVKALRGM